MQNNTTCNSKVKPIEHHIFDEAWIARPSKPHPTMSVQLTLLPEDHAELGFPIKDRSRLTTITIPMVADSGFQSSIIPLPSALAMGINKAEIIPVKLFMCGTIKEDLGVEGGIIARACTSDAVGVNGSTKLMIYVSAKMEKAFLCREALISLGAIHANVPEVPVSWPQDLTASVEYSEPPACHCPRHGQISQNTKKTVTDTSNGMVYNLK
ncbi:hypothetical protein RRG08_040711 [Elysia crispata]|uniref:Uncharacterized protein n=1 Tax=Elysia crispata TaxID=231223 RepID=A0AAE1BDL8_9GAST|nr:hypothetical protein RRG08_040711 [Elysia crispata]